MDIKEASILVNKKLCNNGWHSAKVNYTESYALTKIIQIRVVSPNQKKLFAQTMVDISEYEESFSYTLKCTVEDLIDMLLVKINEYNTIEGN
jgi:hypothetical protein